MNGTPHRRQPAGFTLLEVILALSIASLLLVGVYAAIDQSYKLTASGREEMQRAQLARALIRRIELDIRSITFTEPPPEEEEGAATTSATSTTSTSTSSSSSSSSGGSASGGGSGGGGSSRSGGGGGGGSGGAGTTQTPQSTANTSTTDTAETEALPPNSRSLGIRGTNTQMEMSIARPRRDLLPASGTMAGAIGSSDLRGVTYSFSMTGSAMGSGLIRAEGERMAIEQVEANGGLASQVSQIQVLAPEVIGVSFRYFDGSVWQVAWDSETNRRLPRAVEISIKLQPPQQKRGIFNVGTSRSMETFRTVVLIPISDPYPPEFLE